MAVRELVITGTGGKTVMTKVAVPVPLTLVAPKDTEEVPVVVRVPEISPVEVFTLSPEGSPVAL